MLDMDGTILDLAFDTYVWKELVVGRYAEHNELEYQVARDRLYAKYMAIQGDLEWYCLDHWSERLGFDVLELHREVHHRIDYLPGAKAFLETVRETNMRVLLVTNSHPDTLNLKNDTLGFGKYFDAIHSSHTYGHAKEKQVNLPRWSKSSKFADADAVTAASIDHGTHRYIWDLTDMQGNKVAPGKYLVKAETSFWPSMNYDRVAVTIATDGGRNQSIEKGRFISAMKAVYCPE